MSFGQNIQFLRKMRNKMTQEELAEKLGVSRQTVSKWEYVEPFRYIRYAVVSTEPEDDALDHVKNGQKC